MHRFNSSYRTRPLARTLTLATALMPSLGISRVTDITRLDRLGLPVYASVRPRARGIRVTAGKGVSADEARASALMEAVEHAVADPHLYEWQGRRLSLRDITRQFDDCVGIADFGSTMCPTPDRKRMVTTTSCECVDRSGEYQIPAELVFYPYADAESALGLFGSTTNGLASGNSVAEATLHGLLEVMERDAVAMNRAHDVSLSVDTAGLPEPFLGFAARWHEMGVELSVRSIPNTFGLPCFRAGLYERSSTDVNLAAGTGLHVDRNIALSRAICEAAQSRLSTLHGGRDDITRFYTKYRLAPDLRAGMESRVVDNMFDESRRIVFESIPRRMSSGRSVTAVLNDVLDSLRRAGLPLVLRHSFPMPLNGLHVVKVVVPMTELVDGDSRRIGRRLLKRIAWHA